MFLFMGLEELNFQYISVFVFSVTVNSSHLLSLTPCALLKCLTRPTKLAKKLLKWSFTAWCQRHCAQCLVMLKAFVCLSMYFVLCASVCVNVTVAKLLSGGPPCLCRDKMPLGKSGIYNYRIIKCSHKPGFGCDLFMHRKDVVSLH